MLAMWEIDSFLFAVINPVQSVTLPKEYSPIIKIDKVTSQPAYVGVSCPELLLKYCI